MKLGHLPVTFWHVLIDSPSTWTSDLIASEPALMRTPQRSVEEAHSQEREFQLLEKCHLLEKCPVGLSEENFDL